MGHRAVFSTLPSSLENTLRHFFFSFRVSYINTFLMVGYPFKYLLIILEQLLPIWVDASLSTNLFKHSREGHALTQSSYSRAGQISASRIMWSKVQIIWNASHISDESPIEAVYRVTWLLATRASTSFHGARTEDGCDWLIYCITSRAEVSLQALLIIF